jgi:hypothetical protein
MSKRIVIAPDANGNDQIEFWEDSVLQGTLRMYDLTFLFSRPINDGGKYTTQEIANNSSASIYIGDKRYDRAFFIDYVVERGTLYQAGRMTVIYKEGEDFQISIVPITGDDCGLSYVFSIEGNNIILTATAANSTSDAELKITTKTINR